MKYGNQGHHGQDRELIELLPLLRREEQSERYRELARRLEEDPQLRATFERWQRRWDELDLPPTGAAPLGFAARVVAQARHRAEGGLRWSSAPRWVRLAAAAALLVGTTGGVSLGLWQPGEESMGEEELAQWSEPVSLADDYWRILAEEEASQDEVSR